MYDLPLSMRLRVCTSMFSMQIFIGLNIKTRLINQGSTIWFNVFEEALDLYGIIIIMHMLWVFMVSRSIIYMLIL